MKFKALVFIRLRSSVDDSAGNAVKGACTRLSKIKISKLRLGKCIDIDFEAESRDQANDEIKTLCKKFLANEVIEDWSYELEEVK